MAASLGKDNVLYVATAEAADEEMQRRVEIHRERRPAGWETLEVGGEDLAGIVGAAEGRDVVLVDSLTLWVSARMHGAGDEEVLGGFGRFVEAVGRLDASLILVSDEVGLGVVPESATGRRFRDLLGIVNQRAAAAAPEVYLCVAGLETRIK